MMNDRQKSDAGIVAGKAENKAAETPAPCFALPRNSPAVPRRFKVARNTRCPHILPMSHPH